MAQKIINVGTGANTGDGETLRAGGVDINDNFTELYARIPLTATTLATLIASLPTSPGAVGTVWNNGGVPTLVLS
jgi:hypothetical protein